MTIITVLSIFYFVQLSCASYGDHSPFFQRCIEKCSILNCTEDGLNYLEGIAEQPLYLKLSWDCLSECKYECMWKTVYVFEKRDWKTPQFYGKWPFVRLLGVQEPASTLFSLLNLYVTYTMFKRFKKRTRPDAPLYWLWHAFTAVFINTWFWSTVFHIRDLPFTEFMDYTCATLSVLMQFYVMLRRIFVNTSKYISIFLTAIVTIFFINHATYLSYGNFDYGYNMKVNIFMGSITVIWWFAWCVWNRKQQTYLWKIAAYVFLTVLITSLEIFDFPPIWWTFDSHALWHLSQAIICPLFYSFLIDDCEYLRKMKQLQDKKDS